jgi:uncharacterized CHY-type Zn-finger protein
MVVCEICGVEFSGDEYALVSICPECLLPDDKDELGIEAFISSGDDE